MHIYTTKSAISEFLDNCRAAGKTIGFVPTMGALHKGHISLIFEAKQNNDVVVASIFVNPTQFNSAADLEKYPRMPETDFAMLRQAGCDAVYHPSVAEMYPEQAVASHFELGNLETVLEGAYRPGHFQGVVTIVKEFFITLKPTRAYFGEKDYQQLLVIKRLVDLEHLNVEIVGCPAIREADGLAMSSRNLLLTLNQRKAASAIFEALLFLRGRAHSKHSVEKSIAKAVEIISCHPELAVEYLEIADAETLEPIKNWEDATSARAFAGVFAGSVRLIDNVALY